MLLQGARVQPVVSPQYSHQLHNYQMPPDTAGQAKTKFREIKPSATSFKPSALHPQRSATFSQLRTIYPRLTAPHSLVPDTPTALLFLRCYCCPDQPHFPPLTLEQFPLTHLQMTATPTKLSYNRTVKANTCRKCGQFRTQETGHIQYKGKIFCPNKETITKEQWLQNMMIIVSVWYIHFALLVGSVLFFIFQPYLMLKYYTVHRFYLGLLLL